MSRCRPSACQGPTPPPLRPSGTWPLTGSTWQYLTPWWRSNDATAKLGDEYYKNYGSCLNQNSQEVNSMASIIFYVKFRGSIQHGPEIFSVENEAIQIGKNGKCASPYQTNASA